MRRGAAGRGEAKRFVDTLVSTKRFWRNEKSQILFEVAKGDHVMIVHKTGLRSIIEDAGAVEVTGDLGDACTDLCWFWLLERKWALPRMNPEKSWNPQRQARPGVADPRIQLRPTPVAPVRAWAGRAPPGRLLRHLRLDGPGRHGLRRGHPHRGGDGRGGHLACGWWHRLGQPTGGGMG